MSSTNYTDIDYVIRGGGYLTMDQHFGTIPFVGTNGTDLTQPFDSTNALLIDFDVRILNEKLGIYKDASNNFVIDSSSTILKINTSDDSITITAEEFINNLTEQQVISVGKYSNIYIEFTRMIYSYFSYADGIDSIFDPSGSTIINTKYLTPSDLINILKERYLDLSNNYVYKFKGIITLFQLTNILTFVCENDPFKNRSGYTVNDGFIAGDRLLISPGFNITLDLKTANVDDNDGNPTYEETVIMQYTSNTPLVLTLQNLS
jgi:hypothetical protein